MLPSTPPPDDQPPRSRLTHRLDRHAHPESRTFRYLDFVRAVTPVLTLAGLLALVVQLHQANITARRDAIPASVTCRLRRHPAGGNSDLLALVSAAVIRGGVEHNWETRSRWRSEPTLTRTSESVHDVPRRFAGMP
jgi:hypothetical protein